jgi:hypothetical protein
LSLISFIVAVAGFRATSVGNDVNDENRTKKMRHELRWFVSLLGFHRVRRSVIECRIADAINDARLRSPPTQGPPPR